ncbi:Helicase protein MOM1 [Zea mays]|uniref:Helicase protein MOM1 n=1 Tax=Zea mays TaxID=4577 RepID=A0A1D6LH37_MAIZE|nr:Helicase protein MOM1 [Zea mays]
MSTPSADLHLLPETGVENMRTPKSLHAELKCELSKLNTVLKLPIYNVRFLANQFLEYLLNNHLVVREPWSILHAFNIALCWHAASFLKYTELDHRESIALTSDGLNYECNEAPS